MKTTVNDPWNESNKTQVTLENAFEDSFVEIRVEDSRLPDSEEYLQRLYCRQKILQKGSSKRDLVNSLSKAKEDCMARLITERRFLESEEEIELTFNPMIRFLAPHQQAITTSELVHLLKADALQIATEDASETIDSNTNLTNPTDSTSTNSSNENNKLKTSSSI